MFQIFDTRQPEGDGGPIKNEFGKPMTFATRDDALTQLKILNIDDRRVVIAPPDTDEENAVDCPDRVGRRRARTAMRVARRLIPPAADRYRARCAGDTFLLDVSPALW